MSSLSDLIESKKTAFREEDEIVTRKSHYESIVAKILNGKNVNTKYYDISVPDVCDKIELKKGCSFYLNASTYAKMFLEDCQDITTIFFHFCYRERVKRLKTIYIVENPQKLYQALKLTLDYCKTITNRDENITGKKIYRQHSFKASEIEPIADHIIRIII